MTKGRSARGGVFGFVFALTPAATMRVSNLILAVALAQLVVFTAATESFEPEVMEVRAVCGVELGGRSRHAY